MSNEIDKLLYDALEEAIPTIDITNDLILNDEQSEAILIASHDCIVSGINIVKRLYQILDDEIYLKIINNDGVYVEEGTIIAIISGRTKSILKGKTLALSILSRMSSIASGTREYLEQHDDSSVKLINSNNFTPMFSYFEQLAITHGGGFIHSNNQSQNVRITIDHLLHINQLDDKVHKLREMIDQSSKIEIEVETFKQFLSAIQTDCDIIHFRNMNVDLIDKCSDYNKDKILIANDVSINDISQVSKCDIHYIQVEHLTQPINIISIELKFNK